MIVLDASFAYALLDADDAHHRDAVSWYSETDAPLATTPLVLAEIDHLVMARGGRDATSAFRRDVASGDYDVHWWLTGAAEAADVSEQYRDLGLSLTDGSLVALAAHLRTTAIATFDERHFRAVTPLAGGTAFTLLPADWQA